MYPHPNHRALLVGRICAAAAILIGGAALFGWALDIGVLKNIIPGVVTMKANTAAGMVLCGAAIAGLSQNSIGKTVRLGVSVFGLVVIVLGVMSLGEDIFGWKIGIDQWLFRDASGAVETISPGRMSPVTAFAFLLVGIASLVSAQKGREDLRHAAVSALGATVVAIGALSLIGRISNSLLDFQIWNSTGTAIHTAVGFMFLGLGLLAMVRGKGGLVWSMDLLTTCGFLFGVVSLLAAAGEAYRYTLRLEQAAGWVSHTQQVLKQIRGITAGMANLENSQMGYVYSGSDRLLVAFNRAKSGANADVAMVRSLTVDNPEQQHRLDLLEPLVAQRISEGEHVIAATRREMHAKSENAAANALNIPSADAIGRLLQDMEDEELLLLNQRQGVEAAVSKATFLQLPLGLLISLSILSLGLFFLNAGIFERRRLELGNAQLAAIVRSSDDAIIGKDVNGIVTSWNRGAEKIFGYGAEEMSGQPITRLIPPDRQQEEVRILDLIRRGENVPHFETVRVHRDGHAIDVSVTVSSIRNSAGKVVGASKVVRDITGRIQTEKELRLNEARYRALFEYAPDGIVIADPKSYYIDANASVCRMLGYSRSELIGLHASDIVAPTEVQHVGAALDLINARSEYHREWTFRRKDGSVFEAEVIATKMPDGNLLGMIRDITDRKRAEQEKNEGEARLNFALESIHVGEWDLDLIDHTAYRSLEHDRIFGYRTLQPLWTLEMFLEHVLPDDRAEVERRFKKALAAQANWSFECRIRRVDGEVRWIWAVGMHQPDKQRQMRRLFGIVQDITDIKQAAEELRSTHARLNHLLEHSPAVIYALKLEGEKITPYVVSENMNHLLGFTVAETMSYDWWFAQLHAEDREGALQSISETIANGHSRTEYRLRHKNGKWLWIEDNRRLIRNDAGEPVEFVGVWTDITERKRAELRLLLQHAISAVLAEGASLERTKKKIISTLGKGLGWELGEWWSVDRVAKVLRRSEVWYPPSSEFRDFVDASDVMTFERGYGLPGRVWASGRAEWSPDIALDQGFVRRPISGSLGLHGWIGFPIVLRGEVLGVVGFFSAETQEPDVALLSTLTTLGIQLGQFIDKQQLAEQFRQAQKMEAIGTLAGGVAHDFNNILTVITGYTDLMSMMVTDDPKLLECVEAVSQAGSRATSLVRQILTFSRQEESKREILQLGPIVEEAIKFLKMAIPSSIELKANLSANTPTVLADSTQIHQIVMNLGTNAWHAMKEHPGCLEVKLENFEVDADLAESQLHVRPGKYVRISVSDTGKGMNRDTLSRIFEPFFTTKGPSEGTGLGLSVVHGIVQSHDGAITVYSQPGEGTTFHLYFPAIGEDAQSLEIKGSPIPDGKGKRVLFVDDEEPIVRLSEKMLIRLGYAVETCIRVKDALELVRARPDRFDLVITDMTMPAMSGLDFAQQLSRIRPDLPIILTTGYTGNLKLEQIKAMGIRELLPKPPTLRSLGMAAHRALDVGKPS